jgi:riboflavin synthase
MFTGIVETIGILRQIVPHNDCIHFSITPKIAFADLSIGDSVAVNGVCLTVVTLFDGGFAVTVVPETLRVTNLGFLAPESVVNLERSMKLNGRIGGHCVQGHVDAVGEIQELVADGASALLAKISISSAINKYIVNKGYITLDGMSITVIESTPEWFTVTFIPHTQEVTTVNQYKKGSKINIEVDILGKYIEKLARAY